MTTSIASVIKVKLDTNGKDYDLEILHDLERRLVLLTDQSPENAIEVNRFLNVSYYNNAMHEKNLNTHTGVSYYLHYC